MHHKKNTPSKKVTDEYYTPAKVWDDIKPYFPKKHIVIYEPFYGQGHTYNYFKRNKYNIIGKKGLDFFTIEGKYLLSKCDCVISNPPFSTKYDIIKLLVSYKKPFILTLPLSCINTIIFLKSFNNDMSEVSLIIPKGRMKYIYDGTTANSPSFESCYVCYKMPQIPKLIFLGGNKNKNTKKTSQ